jgi:hypothetical protein
MPSVLVKRTVAFVSVLTLSIIVVVRQYPLPPILQNSPLVVNLSKAEAGEEPNSFSASTTFTPESNINYDIFSTLCLNTTTEGLQFIDTNGTVMQRNKIKEVMILPLRVKEIVLK